MLHPEDGYYSSFSIHVQKSLDCRLPSNFANGHRPTTVFMVCCWPHSQTANVDVQVCKLNVLTCPEMTKQRSCMNKACVVDNQRSCMNKAYVVDNQRSCMNKACVVDNQRSCMNKACVVDNQRSCMNKACVADNQRSCMNKACVVDNQPSINSKVMSTAVMTDRTGC